jgi:hypothetical protein
VSVTAAAVVLGALGVVGGVVVGAAASVPECLAWGWMEKFVFFFVSSGGGKNGRGRGRNGTEAKRGGVRKRGESEGTFRGAAAFSGYAPRERERERERGRPGFTKGGTRGEKIGPARESR